MCAAPGLEPQSELAQSSPEFAILLRKATISLRLESWPPMSSSVALAIKLTIAPSH